MKLKVGDLVKLARPDNRLNRNAYQQGVVASISATLAPRKRSGEKAGPIVWVTFPDGIQAPCHPHELEEFVQTRSDP